MSLSNINIPSIDLNLTSNHQTEKTREDVVKQILTCNDPEGLQRFMAQTDEKCFSDVKKAMGVVRLTRTSMGELTGVQCNSNYYWQAERLSRKKGYKEIMGIIYLNCLQNPHLFEELRSLTPTIKKANFTEHQTQILTFFYNQNKQPNITEREGIIALINSITPDIPRTEHSVRVWFAHRRRREAEEAKAAGANAEMILKLFSTDFGAILSAMESAAKVATNVATNIDDSTASSSDSLSPNDILANMLATLPVMETASSTANSSSGSSTALSSSCSTPLSSDTLNE